MSLVVTPKDCSISVKKAIQQLSKKLGPQGSPTFTGLTVTGASILADLTLTGTLNCRQINPDDHDTYSMGEVGRRWHTIHVQYVTAHSATFASDVTISGELGCKHIVPDDNDMYSLGELGRRWHTLHTQYVKAVDGLLTGSLNVAGTINAGRVNPDGDGTCDLGEADRRWRDLHISGAITNMVVGTDIQAYDAVLDDISALTVVADNEFIVGTGVGTYAHESGATARTSLGVDVAGTAAGLVDGHETTYNHTNYNTAYTERGSQIAGDHLTWDGLELDVGDDWWNSFADITLAAEYIIKGSGANKAEAFAVGANETVLAVNGSGYLSWLAHANWDTAYTHSGLMHDYAYISGNDAGTGITAAELEELSDGSETTLHSHAGGADAFTVKIDAAATAGYIGAASNDGVLRTTTGLSYADGGNFITLGLSHLGFESLTNPGADRIPFWDNSASSFAWLSASTGTAISGTSIGLAITALTLEETPDGATDYIALSDGATHNKISLNGIFGQGLQTTATAQFAKLGVGTETVSPDRLVYFRNTTINTTDNYTMLVISGTKTAGVTDVSSLMRGFTSYFTFNQSGGVIGFSKGAEFKFTHADGDIGDVSNSRYVVGLQLTTKLNGGKLYGYTRGAWFAVDQAAEHEITGDVFGNYISVDLDGTVGGTAYMLYLAEATGLDYGIYQNGTAMNVLGGPLMVGLKTGTDQSNAGATTGELYVDTNDGNTVKMGV